MRNIGRVFSIGLLVLLVTGCGGTGIDTSYMDASKSVEERVEILLSQMTLDEKVGQMTQAERSRMGPNSVISDYYFGSVLSGGGSAPLNKRIEPWQKMTKAMQEEALSTRLAIPILYGVDAVHGSGNLRNATIFPHNINLGAANNPELTEEIGRATAREVLAMGVHWNFGPCLAVARDIHWGRTYESFSENPELVAKLGAAKVAGLQTEFDGRQLIASIKHWVGDGGTEGGLDRTDTMVDEQELRDIHISPYLPSLKTDANPMGAKTVMPSQSTWKGDEMHGHKYLIQDVLKDELGFSGFIISDWNAIDQNPGSNYKDDISLGVNAGIDMFMVPGNSIKFTKFLKDLVEEGTVSMERIDDAVRRILTVKFEMGLFEHPFGYLEFADSIRSDEHLAIARQAVAESMVVLKNDGALPIANQYKRIFVGGANSDNIGNQCGGWTIEWQGLSGDITEGTTLLEAVQNAAGDIPVESYVRDSQLNSDDLVILGVGERPYAEWPGDATRGLDLKASEQRIIDNANASGATVVTVLISGRPVIIDDALDASNALVAAFLPGTEGDGMADILFGKVTPTGKLSFSWPGEGQDDVNVGNKNYVPKFPYGYGLTF